MKNFEMSLPLVNGSALNVYSGDISGKAFIHEHYSDDFGAPPKWLEIVVTTESGKKAKVIIPYDNNSNAIVQIDGEVLR